VEQTLKEIMEMNTITMEQGAHYDALFAGTAAAVATDMVVAQHEQTTRSGNRLYAMTAIAIASAVGVGVFSGDNSVEHASAAAVVAEATVASTTASTEAPTTTEEVTTTTEAATTTTTEAPTVITVSPAETDNIKENVEKLTDDEVTYIYANIVTGNQASKEVGEIEILTTDEEQSMENFYNDLRHNPQTLAFYATCLGQDTPNYENCAEDSDAEGMKVLEDAGKLLVEINEMELRDKAVLAEETIAKFELMEFDGVELHNGTYETMRLKLEDGKVVGFEQSTHVSRPNDPRLHFSYVDKDGNTQEIVIRGCSQITNEVPPTPTPETTTTTTVPEETTTTTVPEETTTTTTTIPETTTTRPEVPVPVSSVVIAGPGSGGEPDTDNDPDNNVTTSTTSTTTTVPTSSTVPPITAPPSVTSTTLGPVIVN